MVIIEQTTDTTDVDTRMRNLRSATNEIRMWHPDIVDCNWNKVDAAMDAIEDCQEAISYYKASVFPDNGGEYLFIYGLFQAMFVQQDAVNALAESFLNTKMKCQDYGLLNQIRTIRDDTVGHPTLRQNKYYIRIVKAYLQKDSLTYVKLRNEPTPTNKENTDIEEPNSTVFEVSISKLIFDQAYFVSHVLNQIIECITDRLKATNEGGDCL